MSEMVRNELRDRFATAAMQGDWASQSAESGIWPNTTPLDNFAERAALYYRMADAMLKAREQ